MINLTHPDRCPHDDIERDPPDYSVGIFGWFVECQECGTDLSDHPDYEGGGEPDPWDDGDRAYDAWKDEREH